MVSPIILSEVQRDPASSNIIYKRQNDAVLEAELAANAVIEAQEIPEENSMDELEKRILILGNYNTVTSQLPFLSSRRSSAIPLNISEEIPQKRTTCSYSSFAIVLGVFCELKHFTRRGYLILIEVLKLFADVSEITLLPKYLNTLKYQVRQQMPQLKLRRKQIILKEKQLPTQSVQKKALPQSQIPIE